MGREIRRVPPGWQHPSDEDGKFLPMFDQDYESAYRDWENDPDQDPPPNREVYRERAWTPEEATAYQVYEDVTEGTPISPVFETVEEMREWIVAQGHSEKAADNFIAVGWVPSMSWGPDGWKVGIDTAEFIDPSRIGN